MYATAVAFATTSSIRLIAGAVHRSRVNARPGRWLTVNQQASRAAPMPRQPPPPTTPVPGPTKPNLDACRRCELWENATQAVRGGGSRKPRLMLIGEQPGDEEDKQ